MQLEYMKWLTSASSWMQDEALTRIRSTPFDNRGNWFVLYEPSPLNMVLRDLLRRAGQEFTIVDTGADLNEEQAILTSWTLTHGPKHVVIRGEKVQRVRMGLYYESGDWGVPQQNFLMDWTEEHALCYLATRGFITEEEACSYVGAVESQPS